MYNLRKPSEKQIGRCKNVKAYFFIVLAVDFIKEMVL
jgi:hypothetical protein